MNIRWVPVLTVMSLSACFRTPPVASLGSVSGAKKGIESPIASAKTLTETKAVYAIDPKAEGETVLSAPSGSLSGASVAIQPNSLAVSADFIFEEAVPFEETSLANHLQIDSSNGLTPVGSGMIIRPSVELELGNPLVISLPLGVGLKLGVKNISVFYKQYREGVLKDGIIASKYLTYTEDNKVSFEGYFGSYWLVESSVAIEEKAPVETSEPIVNFQKVAVIESTGINAESTVTAKAEIPALVWKTPVMSFSAEARSLTLDAETESAAAVSQCVADIFTDVDASAGATVNTGSSLKAVYEIGNKEAHTLFGRFRCFDEHGRLTTSAWSAALSIPALNVIPTLSSSDFYVLKPQLQSREFLRIGLGGTLLEADTAFTIFNSTSGQSLFDASKDTREAILRFKLSPLGQLQKVNYDANQLSLRGGDDLEWATLAFSIRDFPIFEAATMSSFSGNRQMDSDGFQGWTGVIAASSVSDTGTGDTKLTTGMLPIINP